MPPAGACRLCFHEQRKHDQPVGSWRSCQVTTCRCTGYVKPRSAQWRALKRAAGGAAEAQRAWREQVGYPSYDAP